jgi:hypothetical protein
LNITDKFGVPFINQIDVIADETGKIELPEKEIDSLIANAERWYFKLRSLF